MTALNDLSIKIFADGADLGGMLAMAAKPWIQGFTTNPTLMRKAGVTDYKGFALQVLEAIADRPVSFEVFADDLPTMEAQARAIASWGTNVYVKVPVTNTKGVFTGPILTRLSRDGIKLNVTALMTAAQVRAVAEALAPGTPAVISVFAGRIADTGVDPVTVMSGCVADLTDRPELELLWASPRELLNLIQADAVGCHIITMTNDLLGKLPLLGKDHDQYSLETVEMFHRDATAAGYDIPVAEAVGAV
ncbi:transaldolase [Azospirillum griseum]|uniref:Transaldolase n=1 Tax=Azospirillum griseum TaxID=2496639 RepID=A0A3S0JEL8_9PROT|nr:transaldolase [Azospirillum griseum]RTR15542.1 transaldolase [Azospirillum griseum]